MISALGPSVYLQAGVNLVFSTGWKDVQQAVQVSLCVYYHRQREESQKGVLLDEMKPREGKSVFPVPRDTSENGLISL